MAEEARFELPPFDSLTLARVDQLMRPPLRVAADADIFTVARLLDAHDADAVLVDPAATAAASAGIDGVGIFTGSALRRAILDGRPLDRITASELASRPLRTARPSDPLYEALATMVRHRVQRLVVVDDSGPDAPRLLGLLEQRDLLGMLSSHAQLIEHQIAAAPDLVELQAAAGRVVTMIGLLHRCGTRVELIARLVKALDARLFERAWQLVAPPELVANACLFVMGSEGRGEQLLRTDQDNGLVLRDGYRPPADLAAICDRFSQALAGFGYPECPGGIMLSNPKWRHDAAGFGAMVRGWVLDPSGENLMSLAIFLDAAAVAGDASLLERVRSGLAALATGNDVLLARFAAAVNAFDASHGSWWSRLLARDDHGTLLDLKKAGTFPLVHGVRSLALAHQVAATGTAQRLAELVAAGAMDPRLATDLVASLQFFMRLKLELGLTALAAGRQPGSALALDALGGLDRDMLRDTLAVVKRFKALLQQRFHLDAL